MFIMEIYIDLIFICHYLSLSWFNMNNYQFYPFKFLWSYIINHSLLMQQEHKSQILNIQLQNTSRRLMLSKIRNLFRKTISNNTDMNSNSNEYSSLFDYRCPICLCNKQRWIALGCGHILCSLCTHHLYFGNKSICPYCRSPITLSDLTLLYI